MEGKVYINFGDIFINFYEFMKVKEYLFRGFEIVKKVKNKVWEGSVYCFFWNVCVVFDDFE